MFFSLTLLELVDVVEKAQGMINVESFNIINICFGISKFQFRNDFI